MVHLQRTAADPHPEWAEDDHDYEKPRHPVHTAGEELWKVHLKRSEGLPPDYDVDPAKDSDKKPAPKGDKRESKATSKYNLRERKHKIAQ